MSTIINARTRLSGRLTYRKIPAPGPGLAWKLRNILRWAFIQGWLAYHLARPIGRTLGFMTGISCLKVRLIKANGQVIDYGVVSYRVVTTAFVTALASALHLQASPGNLYYHALGTNNAAPAIGDTGMGTELTTEYNPDNTRPAGTHTSAGGVYESIGTVTIDSGTPAVVEHGLIGAASGASTLVDRHTFAAVNMGAGDGFQATYQLTLTAGG